MLVYLDSNIVVYLVEDSAEFTPRAERAVDQLLDDGHRLVVSHLVRMECRTGALARQDYHLLRAYMRFFSGAIYRVLDLPPEVFDHAAELRASRPLSAMDALHLATALVGGCGTFLTNDVRLSSFPSITVMTLPGA